MNKSSEVPDSENEWLFFNSAKYLLKQYFFVLPPVGSKSLLGLANIYVVERETPLDKATYSCP